MQQRDNAARAAGFQVSSARRLPAHPVTLVVCIGMAASLVLSDGHDQQRLWQLAMFAVLAPYLLMRDGLPSLLAGAARRGLRWSLAGFFLCGAISSLLAFSVRRAILEASMVLMLLLVAIAIAREIARDRRGGVMLLLQVCAAGCAAYGFKVGVQYFAAVVNHIQPDIFTFTPGFSNLRFLNHTQTIALPMLALFCLLLKSKTTRCGALMITAFWWALLFATSGRGTMVAMMACCLVAVIMRRQQAFAYCRMMALAACGGLAIYALLFTALPMLLGLEPAGAFSAMAQRTAADPASLRLPLWTRALELIAAHPLFGAGPMHYGHYAIDLQNGAHPHNWMFQFGAEWGIPGLLFLCGALGFAIRSLLRTAPLIGAGNVDDQHMLTAWIATGAAILVDALVSGLFVMPMSQLWIVIYLGCAAGWTMSFQAADASARRGRGIAGSLLLLMAAAGIAAGVAPELADIINHVPRSAEEAALYNGYDHPRIWLGGYF